MERGSPSTSRARQGARWPRAALLLALLGGCEPDAPPEASLPAPLDSMRPAPAAAPDPTVERWRRALPPEALVRSGVCPFECCIYGEWTARSGIPVLREPRAEAAAAFRLAPGTRFAADSGRVHVTGLALVAVADTVPLEQASPLLPGDTLAVLDYVGEGYYHVWRDGRIEQLQGFWEAGSRAGRGELLGRHETEWWVHVTGSGGERGWFRADAPGVELSGVDACGGPPD